MNLGDLVRYDSERYSDYMNHPGIVIKLYSMIPSCHAGCPDRAMADVLFSYGIVADDSYEFEVINEGR